MLSENLKNLGIFKGIQKNVKDEKIIGNEESKNEQDKDELNKVSGSNDLMGLLRKNDSDKDPRITKRHIPD